MAPAMGLTPGLADDVGRFGYYGGFSTCSRCGQDVWACSYGEHRASHEEVPLQPVVVKPWPDWTIAGHA